MFALVERGKARSLAEALPGPRPLAELVRVRAALDAGTTVLYFAVLADRTLVWAITRDAVGLRRIDVPEPELAGHVRALRRALDDESGEGWRAESGWLFETLVRPLGLALQPDHRLVISPDGPVHGIPFPMLWDARRARFLVEDVSVVQVPSAAFLMRGLERGGRPLRRVVAAGFGRAVPGLGLARRCPRWTPKPSRSGRPWATVLRCGATTRRWRGCRRKRPPRTSSICRVTRWQTRSSRRCRAFFSATAEAAWLRCRRLTCAR